MENASTSLPFIRCKFIPASILERLSFIVTRLQNFVIFKLLRNYLLNFLSVMLKSQGIILSNQILIKILIFFQRLPNNLRKCIYVSRPWLLWKRSSSMQTYPTILLKNPHNPCQWKSSTMKTKESNLTLMKTHEFNPMIPFHSNERLIIKALLYIEKGPLINF